MQKSKEINYKFNESSDIQKNQKDASKFGNDDSFSKGNLSLSGLRKDIADAVIVTIFSVHATSSRYDFVGVLQWFAERVDRIILLFDANKLDISDEFRRSIEAIHGYEDKVSKGKEIVFC